MKLGFLYAGQGSQAVGMGRDLYEAYPSFREVLDRATPGFDVKEVSFEGPAEVLNETKYTQPCMVAFAVGMTKVLAEAGIVPEIAAGLSLGEYSALYAAGVFTEQQVIDLVAFRGNAMQSAVQGRACKMIAVLGLEREKVYEGCGGCGCSGRGDEGAGREASASGEGKRPLPYVPDEACRRCAG